ncbi:hypothetical protein F5876DRAFT_74455 [Lentinula aff. lateritia]|uniref:Uncharacterized protein n=1 Tax=Lentinula aff. lateritia TaxID=2804960 RepID=A0ACC1U7R7_9AGAR|nr:hypothetical protein F5876DRAFT_74455 [Lentinula aff. lateritia]
MVRRRTCPCNRCENRVVSYETFRRRSLAAAATVPVQSFARYQYGSSDAGSEGDDEEDGEEDTVPEDMDVDMDEINYITSVSTQQISGASRNSVNERENSGSDSGSDPDIHNPGGHDRLEQIDHVRRTHMLAEETGSDNHNETDEENLPPQQDDQEGLDSASAIERIRITQEFIREIKASKLDNGILSEDDLYRLRNPTAGLVDISDPDTRLSIDIYLATSSASEEVYHQTRAAVIRRYPNSSILSLYEVKKLVAEISGVVAVKDDMCINSCHAFTGPFAELETCSVCAEPRFDPVILEQTGRKVPRLQACTFLLGPQLQALRRSKEMALELQYAYLKTEQILHDESSAEDFVYDDIFCGSDFLDLAEKVKLTPHDIMVSLSVDGAQLYQNKQSDTWFEMRTSNVHHSRAK